MQREERVTVQGPVKKQQPDGMSHRGWVGQGWPGPQTTPPPPPPGSLSNSLMRNTHSETAPALLVQRTAVVRPGEEAYPAHDTPWYSAKTVRRDGDAGHRQHMS